MSNYNGNTRGLVTMAMMIALTMVMTILVQIPIVGGHGYINLGDTIIMFCGLYYGKTSGAKVGAVGSAFADLLSGFAIYFPITLVVKGLEGYVCGALSERIGGKKGRWIGCIVAGFVMVLGYYIGEVFLYGAKGALVGILANTLQAVFGIVSARLVYYGVCKISGNSDKNSDRGALLK